MTVLLIDAGNTRLKWALCAQGQFLQKGAFAYQWAELQAQFREHWDVLAPTAVPKKILLCSVVGDRLESALRQWADAHWLQDAGTLTIETVSTPAQGFGVRCAYQQPAQMGSDRWAALVAARHYLRGISCVIDCGTALTIDVLSAEGVHVGGLIAPGMQMMRDSLATNTRQVQADEVPIDSLFAVQDTPGAVQAGILAATQGAVRQVLQQCHGRWSQVPQCVLTGGNAEQLLAALPKGSLYEPDWVLKGLAIIAGCHDKND